MNTEENGKEVDKRNRLRKEHFKIDVQQYLMSQEQKDSNPVEENFGDAMDEMYLTAKGTVTKFNIKKKEFATVTVIGQEYHSETNQNLLTDNEDNLHGVRDSDIVSAMNEDIFRGEFAPEQHVSGIYRRSNKTGTGEINMDGNVFFNSHQPEHYVSRMDRI